MSFDWRRAARRARAVAPLAWIVSGLCLAAPYTLDTAEQHRIRVVIVASLTKATESC